jgi:hypothetical protein
MHNRAATSTRRAAVEHRNARFDGVRAPCGRVGYAVRNEDTDEDGLVMQETVWSCGCRSLHREYHDGSYQGQVFRHDRQKTPVNPVSSER